MGTHEADAPPDLNQLLPPTCRRLVDCLRCDPGVAAILLFGSYLSGEPWPGSDVDLFVILTTEDKEIWTAHYIEDPDTSHGQPQIHLQVLSSPSLKKVLEGPGGGLFHQAFASAALLHCRRSWIARAHAGMRTPSPETVSLRSLVAYGNALFHLQRFRSAVYRARDTEARQALWQATAGCAEGCLWQLGVYPGRQPIRLLLDLEPSHPLSSTVHDLMNGAPGRTALAGRHPRAAHPVQQVIARRRVDWSVHLLGQLKRAGTALSAAQVEELPCYAPLKTDFGLILADLTAAGLLQRSLRLIALPCSEATLGAETVFSLPAMDDE